MKLIVACMLAATVFAAPCVYDVGSPEPSPLSGFATAAQLLLRH